MKVYKLISCLGILCIMLLFPLLVNAKAKITVNADIVSSYVWRGQYITGASVQPMMSLSIGDFLIDTWGNTDIARGDYKEFDLMLRYSFDQLTVGLSDYWVSNEKNYNVFDFENAHYFEMNLEYLFRRLPFILSWNTMFAGADKYLDSGGKSKQAFSTYIEATYRFLIRDIKLDANIGCSPWRSMAQHTSGYPYATDGFAVVDLSLKATKTLKITEKYALDLFGHIILNPAKEDAFFVFGIRL